MKIKPYPPLPACSPLQVMYAKVKTLLALAWLVQSLQTNLLENSARSRFMCPSLTELGIEVARVSCTSPNIGGALRTKSRMPGCTIRKHRSTIFVSMASHPLRNTQHHHGLGAPQCVPWCLHGGTGGEGMGGILLVARASLDRQRMLNRDMF